MSEVENLPRWGLPEIQFLETDASKVKEDIINTYQELTGTVLANGDPVRAFLSTLSAILAHQRAILQSAARQNFLSTAQGENLNALGSLFNVQRLPASKAVTTLEFTLSRALNEIFVIPQGTEVTNGAITFATDKELLIYRGDLKGSVQATCTEAGKKGNGYLVGEIATVVKPLTFLQGAKNITVTGGGADEETDAKLAERIRLAPNSFSVAGARKAYVFYAKSAGSSISDVSVISPTPGEVKVYPLLEGGVIPQKEVLENVKAKLSEEDVRPLTDFVEVLAPEARNFEIEVHYWISNEDKAVAETIKANVQEASEKFKAWQTGKIGRDITPSKLIQYVMNAGVSRVDRENLKPSQFVKLEMNQVAQCTGIKAVFEGYKDE